MCNDFVLMCIKAINNSYFIDTKKRGETSLFLSLTRPLHCPSTEITTQFAHVVGIMNVVHSQPIMADYIRV